MSYVPLPPARVAAQKLMMMSDEAQDGLPLAPNHIALLAGDPDDVGDAIRFALRMSAPLETDAMTIAAIAGGMTHCEMVEWLEAAENIARSQY